MWKMIYLDLKGVSLDLMYAFKSVPQIKGLELLPRVKKRNTEKMSSLFCVFQLF